MHKKILWCLMGCFSLYASETPPAIVINKNTLRDYKKDIHVFIDTKRNEKNQLFRLPSGNTFFGIATNFIIENVIAPLFTKYGNVNIEEAKIFLGRSFDQEPLLQKALDTIQDNSAALTYLQDIFSQANGAILAKKDGVGFMKIVKTVKHSKVINPKCMGDKNSHGEYTICDPDFYDYSAATLMAFHIFENHVTQLPQQKKRKRI